MRGFNPQVSVKGHSKACLSVFIHSGFLYIPPTHSLHTHTHVHTQFILMIIYSNLPKDCTDNQGTRDNKS